ncbi:MULTISPECIES: hypothetical protein [Microcystis]|uniref:hypothetical protein n=1 Tax=Microcystis TaxID=1125 RepID=UPI0016801BE4|nr:hypothetical protein [Microcystis wesenbergii]MBD2118392.1 hypothetical protein [Microcystis wesenbergii FACHB-1339]
MSQPLYFFWVHLARVFILITFEPLCHPLRGKGYRLYRYRPYLQELLEIESEADLQGILNVIALPERELRD